MKKLVLVTATALACSSSTPVVTPPVDAGGTNPDTSTGNGATFSGTTVAFGTATPQPVPGVKVTAGTTIVTSDAAGKYSLALTKGTPFAPLYEKAGNVSLIEGEITLTGDADRGPTDLVDTGTQALLTTQLPGYDSTLAVFSLIVIGSPSCKSATGATVALDPVGNEKLLYFKAGTPSLPTASQTSVVDGLIPSAIFYNVTVGQKIAVKVTPPAGCKVAAFPFADPTIPTITYTGNVSVVAAQPMASSTPTVSFARYFVQ